MANFKTNPKKLGCLCLFALFASGCDTKDTPTPIATATEQVADSDRTNDDQTGERYHCDNGKLAIILVEAYEGEIEAHATIDDIEYELHPDLDTEQDGNYISHDEGIGGEGMRLVLTDNSAIFTHLDNTPLLTCQKQH